MPFPHNSTGVSADRPKFTPLPDGVYSGKIGEAIEKVSKSGYNMVELTIAIIEDEAFEGKTVKHWVVFIPAGQKGESINVHFRKVIGVPYGGEDTVDATQWVGKKLSMKIGHEVRDGKTFNKVIDVDPYGGVFPEVQATEDSSPF